MKDDTGIGQVSFNELFRPCLQVSWKVAGLVVWRGDSLVARRALFCSTTESEAALALESRRAVNELPTSDDPDPVAATLTCKMFESMSALSNRELLRTTAFKASLGVEEVGLGAENSSFGAGLFDASSAAVWGIVTETLTSGALWSSTAVVNLNCDFMCEMGGCPGTYQNDYHDKKKNREYLKI